MLLNKAQKLVRITELLYRRDAVRATELMDRFELDPRTMRRYLSDMRELGIPIEDHGVGFERSIGLPSDFRRTGVQLGLSEVLSLHFGRRLFNFLDGTGFASDLDDAIERLQPAAVAGQAGLPEDLDRRFLAVPEHAKDYAELGDVIDEIITSLIYDNPARAEYTKPDGSTRSYSLEPYTLATYRQGLYLFARDRADGKVKTLAVERFSSFDRLRLEKFTVPEGYDPAEMVRDAFGIIGGQPVPVTLRFDARVAPYVRERRWHRSQQILEEPDGRLRMRLHVALSEELVGWLLSFGGDVAVEDPPELVDRLRGAHEAAIQRLSGASG
ncbi:MAG: WYL domain-containing transcriptional regulator [Alphaproteobacteria bacterium]|nr:WYL domain-containing transcriptional regulator [Alphaproteobacteria bacterium]MCB9793852.1 WYL domain-containing transcriptional regulator [Alphaproteobacteria bacterium]